MEERSQAPHQSKDGKAEDQERGGDRPEEQERAHGQGLQRSKDDRESQEDEPGGRRLREPNSEQENQDREEQEEGEACASAGKRHEEDQEEVEEEPHGHEPPHVSQGLADFRRLSVYGLGAFDDSGVRSCY